MLNTTSVLTTKKLFTIINKSDFACAIIQQNGRIVFFNDLFDEMFNYGDENSLPINIFKLLEDDETSNE